MVGVDPTDPYNATLDGVVGITLEDYLRGLSRGYGGVGVESGTMLRKVHGKGVGIDFLPLNEKDHSQSDGLAFGPSSGRVNHFCLYPDVTKGR